MKKNIDEHIEDILKEETAQSKAVKSLIEVRSKEKDELGSDIELKTDLTEKDVCLHTAADMFQQILNTKNLSKINIISSIVELKERKLLSKNRKSRQEIVEVARNPDMSMITPNTDGGFVKKFFSSQRNRQ